MLEQPVHRGAARLCRRLVEGAGRPRRAGRARRRAPEGVTGGGAPRRHRRRAAGPVRQRGGGRRDACRAATAGATLQLSASARTSPSGPGSRAAPSAAIASRDEAVPALAVRRSWPAPQTISQRLRPGQRDVEQPAVLVPDQRAARRSRRRRARAALPRPAPARPAGRRRGAGSAAGCGPPWRTAVSGRITIGASRPLAPCTVITRTWSAPSSLRRFTATSSRSIQSRKPVRLGASTALVGERLVEQRVDAVLGLGAEPGDELPPPVVADEDAGQQLEGPQVVGLRQQVVERARAPRASARAAAARSARPERSPGADARARRARARSRRRAGCAAAPRARGRRRGVAATRSAASRSLTASSPPIRSRSAPATGTRARFSARMIAWKRSPRRCTRIITSPARIARPSGSPGRARPARQPAGDLARDAPGEAPRPGRRGRGRRPAGPTGLSSGFSGFGRNGQSSTRPGLSGSIAWWAIARASPCPAGPPKTASTSARIGARRAERVEQVAALQLRADLGQHPVVVGAAWRRTRPGRRPGSCRSTASRRRRRRSCGAASRAPSPAKNSSEIASITRHCAGLVSCASSTRMWSRPPSSRQSTQAAVPGRVEQRLRRGRSGRRSRAGRAPRLRSPSQAASQARPKRLSAADLAKAALASRSGRAASTRRISASSSAHQPRMRGADRAGRELPDLGGERGLRAGAEQEHGFEQLEPGRRVALRRAPPRAARAAAPSLPGRGARSGTSRRSSASASGGSTSAASAATVTLGPGAERRGEARGVERRRRRRRGAGRSRGGARRGRRRACGGRGRRTRRAAPAASVVEHLLAQRPAPGGPRARANCGATPASSGKRRSSASQKAWMVWILQAARRLERAGEERAGAGEPIGRDRLAGLAELGAARRAASASSSIAQAPSVLNSRFCISAAAALV